MPLHAVQFIFGFKIGNHKLTGWLIMTGNHAEKEYDNYGEPCTYRHLVSPLTVGEGLLEMNNNQFGSAHKPQREMTGADAAAHIHFFQPVLKISLTVKSILFISQQAP